jgi:hypothetical protein
MNTSINSNNSNTMRPPNYRPYQNELNENTTNIRNQMDQENQAANSPQQLKQRQFQDPNLIRMKNLREKMQLQNEQVLNNSFERRSPRNNAPDSDV